MAHPRRPWGWRYLLAGFLVVALLSGCGLPAGSPTHQGKSSDLQPAPAAQSNDRDLNATLASIASRYQGRLGVYVKKLGSGETATLNAGQRFRAASLYKLFVLYTAFSDIQAGKLSLGETIALSQEAAKDDPYVEWQAGSTTTAACALKSMVTISSNAATDMLIDRLGGRAHIEATVRAIGVKEIGLDADGYAYTSPADVALILERIADRSAVSPDASNSMLNLLFAQRRNDRLPLPLPLSVRVAHKTGELPNLRNDAGIVYSPSGPYIFVAMADGANGDAAARQVIVDLSRAVYDHFQPDGLTQYYGLPPRLAQEVFRVPDAKGRLAPLDDQWSETVSVGRAGVALAKGVDAVQLREMVVPDLLQMQQAASAAGADFWVTAGFQAPRDSDWPLVDHSASAVPCPVEEPPPPTPTPGAKAPAPSPAPPPPPPPPPAISQQWLGTLVVVSDSPDGKPTAPTYAGSAAGRWLAAHAWQYGFVEAPVESPAGAALDYEPWKLRWVGRDMAAHLHAMDYEANPTRVVLAELGTAEHDLSAGASTAVAAKP